MRVWERFLLLGKGNWAMGRDLGCRDWRRDVKPLFDGVHDRGLASEV
jgi:hypothetical protein